MFHDTSLCFISCHLAAHQEQVASRNANYRDIIQKMRFGMYLITWFDENNIH